MINEISERLVLHRLNKAIRDSEFTQVSIAECWECSSATLILWMQGKRVIKIGQLISLCNVLEIDILDLLRHPNDSDNEWLEKTEIKNIYEWVCSDCGHKWNGDKDDDTCSECEE